MTSSYFIAVKCAFARNSSGRQSVYPSRFRQLLVSVFFCILFQPIWCQTTAISANAHQRILATYQLVKDSFLTLKNAPFAVNSNSFTEASFEQTRSEIWKGNLQPVRTYMLQAFNSEDVANNPRLHLVAKSVWVDYLIGIDSFSLAYSQASQLVYFADSLKLDKVGLAYLALARASAYMNETYAYSYKNVEKVLTIAATTGDATLEGRAQLVAGMLARKYFYGSSGRSIPYYDKAIAAATRAKDTFTLIRGLMLKQNDLEQAHQMEKGIPYLEEAIHLAIRTGSLKLKTNICEELFLKLEDIGEYNKSTEMLLLALDATKQFGMKQVETHMYMQLSEMYNNRKMYDSSLYYLNQTTAATTMVPGAKTNKIFKADLYYAMGRYKQAAELYHNGMDEYLNAYVIHGQDELNRWETNLRTQEKEAELQKQAGKRKQLIWVMSGIAAVLLITLVALLWQRSLRKKVAAQNRLISRQSQKLEQSLAEKELLLREIHHRVKNNLQVIDSLLDLHQGSKEFPESQLDSFTKARTHVHTISMIHQNLYQQDHLSCVSMHTFVSELFTQTEKIFNKTSKAVIFKNGIPEDAKLDVDTAVPLGLILNELLTNAYKYVLPHVTEMKLSLDLIKSAQPHQFVMHYQDNGPGLPQGFDFKKEGSMGTQLVRQLSRQIGGKTTYTFQDGAHFSISFLTIEGRKEIE